MVRKGMHPERAAELRKQKGLEETKLQRIRVKKGYSQNDLAEMSGVSKRRIMSYEHQEVSIDRAKLEALCALSHSLGCKIEDILENEELIKKYKAVK